MDKSRAVENRKEEKYINIEIKNPLFVSPKVEKSFQEKTMEENEQESLERSLR